MERLTRKRELEIRKAAESAHDVTDAEDVRALLSELDAVRSDLTSARRSALVECAVFCERAHADAGNDAHAGDTRYRLRACAIHFRVLADAANAEWAAGDRCEVDTDAARIGSGAHAKWLAATVLEVRERMLLLDVDGAGRALAWKTDVRRPEAP